MAALIGNGGIRTFYCIINLQFIFHGREHGVRSQQNTGYESKVKK